MMIDLDFAGNIKGFMDDEEGMKLYDVARRAAESGPLLEIGSYCGKSAYFLGTACREKESVLFSLDHHRGSPEQQKGEEYFDPDLFDEQKGRIDTFPVFMSTIERALLSDTVIPVVSSSAAAGRMWKTPVSLLFIDGGHGYEEVLLDYEMWAQHIVKDGFLVMHDIFFDNEKGGEAPRKVWEKALESGLYEDLGLTKTLAVLRRR